MSLSASLRGFEGIIPHIVSPLGFTCSRFPFAVRIAGDPPRPAAFLAVGSVGVLSLILVIRNRTAETKLAGSDRYENTRHLTRRRGVGERREIEEHCTALVSLGVWCNALIFTSCQKSLPNLHGSPEPQKKKICPTPSRCKRDGNVLAEEPVQVGVRSGATDFPVGELDLTGCQCCA